MGEIDVGGEGGDGSSSGREVFLLLCPFFFLIQSQPKLRLFDGVGDQFDVDWDIWMGLNGVWVG